MRKIGKEEIENIALGAAVLGTGGGGDPYVGKLMAQLAVEKYGPVTLLSPEEIDDDAWVVSISGMGAPSVTVEKIPSTNEITGTFEAIQKYAGKDFAAVYPYEVGGLNSLIPIVLGALKGIPVVDVDGMGRAFPEVQMVTFCLDGLQSAPMAMSDDKGNSLILNGIDSVWNERIGRQALDVMGGSVTVCDFMMQGRDLKRAGIHGTLTLAENIGKTIHEVRHVGENPVQALVKKLGGVHLFSGKVTHLERRTTEGFAKGEVKLDGIDQCLGQTARLDFKNEFLIATVGEEVVATTPDLISVLDFETGLPITTEGLRYGNRIAVIGLSCNEKWRTEKGIETVGPRYFGYDLDYRPLKGETGA